jgi:hypothetical protein
MLPEGFRINAIEAGGIVIMRSKLVWIGVADVAICAMTVLSLWQENEKFYTTCIGIAKSNGAMMVNSNYKLGSEQCCFIRGLPSGHAAAETSVWLPEDN